MQTTKQNKKVRIQLNTNNDDPIDHHTYQAYIFRNMKQTIKNKSLEINHEYKPITKVVHSQNQYLTVEGRTNFVERYRYLKGDLLKTGFFAPQREPYVSVGTVHTIDDLVLEGCLSKIKNKMNMRHAKRPDYLWSHAHNKMALPSLQKHEGKKWTEKSLKVRRTQTDYSSLLISQKLNEMKKLRSWVNAKKKVRDFLKLQQQTSPRQSKDIQMDLYKKKSSIGNLHVGGFKKALNNIHSDLKMLQIVKSSSDESLIDSENDCEETRETDKRSKIISVSRDKEKEKLQRQLKNYRDHNKKEYRRKKTKYIKQLLCAIYNMRTRTIKTK